MAHNIKVGIPTDYLKDLILVCTENIRFDFEGEAYEQIDGDQWNGKISSVNLEVHQNLTSNLTNLSRINKSKSMVPNKL